MVHAISMRVPWALTVASSPHGRRTFNTTTNYPPSRFMRHPELDLPVQPRGFTTSLAY
ncbi:hypothetical protein EI94DRAFT_1759550 [Lactarius quietus]|nr:hypothetical protein EI94DRAFT_1759550 [Lactarius quietus]